MYAKDITVPVERIEKAILLVHGQEAILDKDLAVCMVWRPEC
jgi:hypothetical protein